MNLVFALVVAVTSWVMFSSMNALSSAGEGCCETKTCGKSVVDKIVWWVNLFIAVMFSLYVVLVALDKYGPKQTKGKGYGSSLTGLMSGGMKKIGGAVGGTVQAAFGRR
jgi:hypothetical protein